MRQKFSKWRHTAYEQMMDYYRLPVEFGAFTSMVRHFGSSKLFGHDSTGSMAKPSPINTILITLDFGKR